MFMSIATDTIWDGCAEWADKVKTKWVKRLELALDGPDAYKITKIKDIVNEMKRFKFSE
jgi:hypothetical protein